MIGAWHLDHLLELRKNINTLKNTMRIIEEHTEGYRPELDLYYKELREFNAEIKRMSDQFDEKISILERKHTATHECEGCKDYRVHRGARGETYHYCRCKDRCVDCVKVKEGIEHERK